MDVPVSNIILWILSLFGALLSGLLGIVAKMLWEIVGKMQKQIEKLETRMNAMEVSIVKVDSMKELLQEIRQAQKDHFLFHDRLTETLNQEKIKTEKIRSKYIPKIDTLEERYEEILSELRKLSKLSDLVK